MEASPPVVVGIDFSHGASSALAWAIEFARLCGSPVLAIHASDRRDGPLPAELRWLEDFGLPATALVVRRGMPWLEIARFVDEVAATALVIGSHGARGYQALVPGSTTMLLLTRVRRPVVIVPALPHPGARSAPQTHSEQTR